MSSPSRSGSPALRSSAANVLAEHLPAGYTAAFDGNPAAHPTDSPPPPPNPSNPSNPSNTPDNSRLSSDQQLPLPSTSSSSLPYAADPTSEDSSLKLQGGDIHRDLFKLDTAARARMHRRANTFHYPQQLADNGGGDAQDLDPADGMTYSEQRLPGGFRRHFIQQQQRYGRQNFIAARMPVTRNFVEFLELYGSFAGEDLADSDDDEQGGSQDDGDDEEGQRGANGSGGGDGDDGDDGENDARGPSDERRPLLKSRKSSRAPVSRHDASTARTFFTLLKAFIGTGIMFLPKAFNNGGILFSTITLLVVSSVTMFAFHLLLECKRRCALPSTAAATAVAATGYGDIGARLAGKRMRSVILTSITLSQLGFVCTGIVFVAENLTAFFQAVTTRGGGESPMSSLSLILVQLAVLIPMSFIRNVSKLGPLALLADVCILVGAAYIYQYTIGSLARNGINPTVRLFNPDQYTMTIGSAIFTFEGIGLILPIEASMAEPRKFEPLLGLVMAIITVLFTSVGVLCYAVFGSATRIEVITNFPQDDPVVNTVQFVYSLAVLVGNPVQLFPALRILEARVFGQRRSGRRSARVKWRKNGFRALLVLFCGAVSILGASNLDRFVALLGSIACVPLVYVYPPYLHYRGVAKTWRAKALDLLLMTVGVVAMAYTTTVTVLNSFL